MSKSITVPDIGYIPIRIQINNDVYTLMPGATVTVPDAVAAIVEAIAANRPQPDPDISDKQPATLGQVKALIAAAGGGLPAVDAEDNGKVLGVSSGAWAPVDASGGLPEVDSGDNGKVLGVSSGAWAAVAAPSGLPTVAAADNGKTLQVASGAWSAVKTRLDVTFTVSVDAGTGSLSVTSTKTFAEIVAAYQASQDLVAWIFMPGGALMQTRSCVINDPFEPTSIAFMVVADLTGHDEPQEPTLYQITMTADGFNTRVEPLTLVT